MTTSIPSPFYDPINRNRNDLALLTELLEQIRGVAGDAASCGHVSALGRGAFSAEAALQAIYRLADAGHSIPSALADGPEQGCHFLLEDARNQVATVGEELFGDRSPFDRISLLAKG